MRLPLALAFLLCALAQPAAAQDAQTTIEAEIVDIQPAACAEGRTDCFELRLVSRSRASEGQIITIQTDDQSFIAGKAPALEKGDRVMLLTQIIDGQRRYVFADLVRRPAILLLLLLFCASVALVGGLQSLRSLAGLGLSLLLLFGVLLPRFLAGDPPLLLALAGGFAIMGITFLLTHGWNAKTLSALIGTGLSLLLTGFLAVVFAHWAALFGLADENAVFLLSSYPDLDLRGLLLAGAIIGALGTLDDVTIAQASAVFELRIANASLGARELYRRALRIGRDHIAGVINTLVLAYAGASLPLLLLLASDAGREPWFMLISRETFATEIVRTVVGSMGLLAAVPLTTFVASVLAARLPSSALATGHGHHH